MPTAFRIAWDSAVMGKILKYDDDPECSYCSEPIANGDQYGCELCGQDVCESCMEEPGGYDNPGYRGEIDSPHAIENHPEFNGGAYCVQCVSDMLIDGALDSDGNPIPDDEEMPVPPNQEVAVPENPLADMSDEELVARINEFQRTMGDEYDPLHGQLVNEFDRRYRQGSPEQRTTLHAQSEGNMNRGLKEIGMTPSVVNPDPKNEFKFGFPRGFGDKFASDDAFTSAWDVVKRGRV